MENYTQEAQIGPLETMRSPNGLAHVHLQQDSCAGQCKRFFSEAVNYIRILIAGRFRVGQRTVQKRRAIMQFRFIRMFC